MAVVMMPMMLTRLCSGLFFLGLGTEGGRSLTLVVLSIQERVLCRSAI